MTTMEAKVALTLKKLHDSHPNSENPSFKRYFSCFSPDARFLGTQATDNWDMEEYKRYLLPLYTSQRQRVIPVKPQEESRKITICAGGWFATFDEVLLGLDEKQRLKSELRGSGSMIYNNDTDSWMILQYHLSIPIPNDAALAVSRHLPQPHPFPDQEPEQEQPPAPSQSVPEATTESSSSKKKKKKKAKK
mmetsp:Transcript_21757/g.36635  ORF Transcript_21757/g.36635 Transcript_21757/m.36635 type:complete len:191 (-) Transcript_21757:158-730(-)